MHPVIGSAICFLLRKHARGKRVDTPPGPVWKYRCPRCHATWTRKVRKPAAE